MSQFKVHGALFTVALIYGANYSVAKAVMDTLPPFAIIMARVAGAGLLFWLLHATTIKESIRSKKDYLHLAVCGLFGVAINQMMFFKGLSLTGPINASVIMVSSPILVLIASSFILKEKITILKALGVLSGSLGAFMLIGGTEFKFATETAFGDLLILINASSYALYLVLVKPLMRKYNALTITKWIFFFGLLFTSPFCLPEFVDVSWQQVSLMAFLGLGFIVLFTTFTAYLLNAWSLRFVNPSIVGAYIYLQPILASIFALSLGQDQLSLEKVSFGLLIFIGVFLVSKK
ncbi:MAG: DMT family transporter [Flammeovirgaceae bacterium]